MGQWFADTIIANGRLPLFVLMVAFAVTFLFIRFSTRMIRAEVSWWPGNVTPGGLHIHHMVFGLVMMLISGLSLIALANYQTPVANCLLAGLFGIGSALVLDEFALVLHLRDVYWEQEGRASIDAVFIAFAITVLFMLGVHPLGLTSNFDEFRQDHDVLLLAVAIGVFAFQYGLAAITLFKGKIWTGLLGLFFPILLVVGAIRVSRPAAPWAKWRYDADSAKLAKSISRERRYRQPVERVIIAIQDAVSGLGPPDKAPAEPATSDLPPDQTVSPKTERH